MSFDAVRSPAAPAPKRIDTGIRWEVARGGRMQANGTLVVEEPTLVLLAQSDDDAKVREDLVRIRLGGQVCRRFQNQKGVLEVHWQGLKVHEVALLAHGPFETEFNIREFYFPSTFAFKVRFESSRILSKDRFSDFSSELVTLDPPTIEGAEDTDRGAAAQLIATGKAMAESMGLVQGYMTPHRALALQTRIVSALRDRTPFSVVRLGDGEGRLLGYPTFFTDVEVLIQVLYYHFGPTSVDEMRVRRPEDWLEHYAGLLKDMISESVKSADVLGLPVANFYSRQPVAAYFGHAAYACAMFHGLSLARRKDPESFFGTNMFQILAAEGLLLREAAQAAEAVCMVGPWPITEAVGQALGRADLEHIQVPGHATWRGESGHGQFPDLYLYVEDQIVRRGRLGGQLFLIGAGILGKYYCDLIRKRGGVALDVGSVLDSWAGRGLPYALENVEVTLEKYG
ncbi:hypothetical protein ACO2Q1_13250 [Brevundimonas sp. VNH65]|uniref:GT-D fold domain-containing protein n=1 Tax=Brevundimonas sp. VNH65 TaxID=3400917 RepID=UPI003C10A2C8